jgi:hypothetical protein
MSEERKIGPKQPRSTAFRLFVAGAYLSGSSVLGCFTPPLASTCGGLQPRSGWNKMLAVLAFVVAAAFFVGARWALARAGISIFRSEKA